MIFGPTSYSVGLLIAVRERQVREDPEKRLRVDMEVAISWSKSGSTKHLCRCIPLIFETFERNFRSSRTK